MKELKPRIHDESNGLDYVLVGDYYVPDLKIPEENRPISKGADCTGHIWSSAALLSFLPSVCPADSTPGLQT